MGVSSSVVWAPSTKWTVDQLCERINRKSLELGAIRMAKHTHCECRVYIEIEGKMGYLVMIPREGKRFEVTVSEGGRWWRTTVAAFDFSFDD